MTSDVELLDRLKKIERDIESTNTLITSTNTKLDEMETKLDDFREALSSVGTDSWRVETV